MLFNNEEYKEVLSGIPEEVRGLEGWAGNLPKIFMDKGPNEIREMIQEQISKIDDAPENAAEEVFGAIL